MNTPQTSYRVKNPSVTLYAFHIREDFASEEVVENAPLLWESLAELSETFSVPELKELPEKLICYKEGQYNPAGEQGEWTYRLNLLQSPDGLLKFRPVSGSDGLTGSVYPVRFHDTYAADLTLLCENQEIEVSQLSHFNPKGALLPSRIRASLGQTLLLYAELPDGKEADRELADECVKAFMKDSDRPCPGFSKQGRLFGISVFEYENYEYDPMKRCHIWVWLNKTPQALELVGRTHHRLMNLLLCRHKILFTYHQSRDCMKKAKPIYNNLEVQSDKLSALLEKPREERVSHLEPLLIKMPAESFAYDRHLRDLEDYATTTNVNAENYSNLLKSIDPFKLPDDDPEFLEDFYNQAHNKFLRQIRTDLNYLTPGQKRFRQASDTIRGIVEIDILKLGIDALKQMRENEENEFKRQNELELMIAFIASVFAGATIFATIDPGLAEDVLEVSHPLGILLFYLVFIGFPMGVITSLIVYLIHKWR